MRELIGPVPAAILKQPRDYRGFPVPWFVAWHDGKPRFEAMDPKKFARAVRESRCWVCGGKLYKNRAFVIGPMCVVNRVTAEPPNHVECAEFAMRNCPFLVHPKVKRAEVPEEARKNVAGIMIERNPGVCAMYITEASYKLFKAGAGYLFSLGPPKRLEFYAHSRRATDAEITTALDTGVDALWRTCELDEDPADSRKALVEQFERFDRLMELHGYHLPPAATLGTLGRAAA